MQKNKRRSLRSTVLLGIMNVAGYTLPFGSICRVVLGELVVGSVSDPIIATRISGPRMGCIIWRRARPRSGQMGPRRRHVQEVGR